MYWSLIINLLGACVNEVASEDQALKRKLLKRGTLLPRPSYLVPPPQDIKANSLMLYLRPYIGTTSQFAMLHFEIFSRDLAMVFNRIFESQALSLNSLH